MEKLIRIDFDNIGDKIDFFLYEDNFMEAQEISNSIKKSINEAINLIYKIFKNAKILLIGADDLLFSCHELKKEQLEVLMHFFFVNTNQTVSIGVGKDIREAMLNLKIAKVSGKNIIKGI